MSLYQYMLYFEKGEVKMSVESISQNAMTVLEKRYLAKDENGNLTETV